MSKLNKLTLLSILFLAGPLAAENCPEACCEPSPNPERITLRHIEGKGVGYNQGYTTLEGFFTVPSLMDTVWFPFVDLRGHIFNDGKAAANAGFGVRYLTSSHVWGINSYYDYRNTKHRHYNQYGLGFECLGRVFDFRINGYLPFGKKQSSYFQKKTYFHEHSLIFSKRREFAFRGANAEIGAHTKLSKNINLYAAAGPYFIGHGSRNAWGGEFRLALDLTKYVRIEGNASYDRIFKGIGQGQLSLNLPFGPRKQIHRRRSSSCPDQFNSCSRELMLRDRAMQRVDRDEIIVLEKRRFHTTAKDPATGLPYFFIFVNNTSQGDGTFEAPFPTLTLAQNNSAPGNIILVYPGSGSPYLNQPIILKDNQKLLGTSLSYTLQTQQGPVTIPALSSTAPIISTTTSTTAVTLGNNNEIAGLNFSGLGGRAILGGDATFLTPGITNTNIHDNTFSQISISAITLSNSSGNLLITRNQMTNVSGEGIAINNQTVPVNSSVTITNNSISGANTGIGIQLNSPSGHMDLFLGNNTVNNCVGNGIIIVASSGGQTLCATVQNNTATNSATQFGFLGVTQFNTGVLKINLSGNTFTGNFFGGFQPFNQFGNNCYSLTNNISLNNGVNAGYRFVNVGGNLNVENFANLTTTNTGSVANLGIPPTSVPVGTCSCQ